MDESELKSIVFVLPSTSFNSSRIWSNSVNMSTASMLKCCPLMNRAESDGDIFNSLANLYNDKSNQSINELKNKSTKQKHLHADCDEYLL